MHHGAAAADQVEGSKATASPSFTSSTSAKPTPVLIRPARHGHDSFAHETFRGSMAAIHDRAATLIDTIEVAMSAPADPAPAA
jgi:hypothetical protein